MKKCPFNFDICNPECALYIAPDDLNGRTHQADHLHRPGTQLPERFDLPRFGSSTQRPQRGLEGVPFAHPAARRSIRKTRSGFETLSGHRSENDVPNSLLFRFHRVGLRLLDDRRRTGAPGQDESRRQAINNLPHPDIIQNCRFFVMQTGCNFRQSLR